MFDVTIVLLGNGLSSTSIMPAEIFHAAGQLWNDLQGQVAAPAFRVRTVSLDGKAVRSLNGVIIQPDAALAEVQRTDIIIVPTSGVDLDLRFMENSGLLPWLRMHHGQGAYLVGVCMGAAYLAEAGLLDGRLATTHWAFGEDLAARYPQVLWRTDQFVTEDNRLLCSGGVYSAIDVSFYLVEKLCGREVAVQCAKALLLPLPRTHQLGYAVLPFSRPHDNKRIRTVESFMQANFHSDLSTPAMAELAGLSERTFVRHFKAATGLLPAAYLQAVRIEAAKDMLERDSRPIHAISADVGYHDVDFFRSLFKRLVRMTPGEYRARFAPLTVHGEAQVARP